MCSAFLCYNNTAAAATAAAAAAATAAAATAAAATAAAATAAAAAAQAYILFRAKLASPFTFSSGPESLEVALFDPAAIPFDQIAFSSVSITLQHYLQVSCNGQQ
jgi:ADP-ribose/FAD diphosphatase